MRLAQYGSSDHPQVLGNATNELAGNTETWRINDNGGRLFEGGIQARSDNNVDVLGVSVDLRYQWIINEQGNRQGNEQGNERIAIAARKHTEAMRLAPMNTPSSLYLDPFPVNGGGGNTNGRSHAVRAAYYSAGFILQRVLADKLDIDPSEVEIADLAPRTLEDTSRVGEIVLADELPNGSGFVRALHENLNAWLPDALGSATTIPFMNAMYAAAHQGACKDSCYHCLRVYRNMNYHSLLDWRLGVGLLRILHDPQYRCGADGNFNAGIEMSDWIASAEAQANAFQGNFPGVAIDHVLLDDQPIPMLQTPNTNYLIIHPFWNFDDPGDETWLSRLIRNARDQSNGKELSWVDHFNLHRRIGWCYANILNA